MKDLSLLSPVLSSYFFWKVYQKLFISPCYTLALVIQIYLNYKLLRFICLFKIHKCVKKDSGRTWAKNMIEIVLGQAGLKLLFDVRST